jgi:hypothetical protein
MVRLKITIRLLFLIILITGCFYAYPKLIEADTQKWSEVPIPANGVGGQWVLAEGSDLRCLTMASNGALYCYANPASTPFRLFKSTDNGSSWSYTGRVEDTIVDIAILPGNPDLVYYATTAKVFKSADAGKTFVPLAANPGESGTGNVEITTLDVSEVSGVNHIAVGIRDTDASQYGGVLVLNESQPNIWQDCGIGTYDVYKVAFSPHFSDDHKLTFVGTDEKDTVISSITSGSGGGSDAGEARLTGLIPVSACIAFPDDYDSNPSSEKYIQFISLNTGTDQGGVYCLKGRAAPAFSTITNLKVTGLNPEDISSLSVGGNANEAKILAGSADTPSIYFSNNAGAAWVSAAKPPTGDSVTGVLMSADFSTSGLAYTTSSGPESAFSVSRDQGNIWSQTGLIDTRISTILDLALSPDYTQDARLFLLTADIQNSVWYSSNGGSAWQRIYYTSFSRSDRINLILLSPKYSQNGNVLLGGTSDGNPVIWKSENNGQYFTRHASVDPTGNPVNIDTWAITSDGILFVGSYDGEKGIVYQTGPDSLSYIDKGIAGSQILNSVVLSPDYGNDHTILAGNICGSVFFSNDNGLVFEPLPFDMANPPLSGNISVAFDTAYPQNKTVYAADDTEGKGIYRFIIGTSRLWESIDASLPDQARIGQITISQTGTLYALNRQPIDNTAIQGGIERSLDSTASTPVFETVTSGLQGGITLKKLWMHGSTIWAADATNNNLMSFTDNLVTPIILNSPANGASGLDSAQIALSWEPRNGAAAYHWQINNIADFSNLAKKFEGDTASPSVVLNSLDSNTTYYWRVRSSLPVISPWSSIRSFNTIKLEAPTLNQPGSTGTTSIMPIFKWSACANAENYELLVSKNDNFTEPAINKTDGKACNANVWASDVVLEYSTVYYWRVRAVSAAAVSNWSTVSLFTTEAASTPAPTPVLGIPKPSSPVSSASASTEPVFKWSPVEGADRYELVISKSDNFTALIIDKVCYANAWKCDKTLAYSTAYYWKVKAFQGEAQSAWSSVNVFTTKTQSSGGSSGGSGSSSRPVTPAPISTPIPASSISPSVTTTKPPLITIPSDTAMNNPSPSPTPQTTKGSSDSITILAVPSSGAAEQETVPIRTTSPIFTSASTATPPASPAGSNNPLLWVLVGGLAVLTTIMSTAMIYLLKKFRRD